VRRKVAPCFRRAGVAPPRKQPQHQIIDHRQRMRGMTSPHTTPIFMQGHSAATPAPTAGAV